MNKQHWDKIIGSETKKIDLKLKDIWNYRDLLFLLVKRDFVAFYKQTILGPIWFLIQPLFTMSVYIFVFGNLASIPTDGVPKPLFYLVGISAWTYFSDCLLKTSTVFKDNADIFGKVYFPRIIMPFSIIMSNLVRFGVTFFLVILLMTYYLVFTNMNFHLSWYLCAIPWLIILMGLQGLGLGMIISSLTTKYRDLSLLVTFGVQLLMYATTVVYPLSSLKGAVRTIISLNPLTYVIEGIRKGLLGSGTFDISALVYITVVSFIVVFLGIIIFNRVEKNFIDTI